MPRYQLDLVGFGMTAHRQGEELPDDAIAEKAAKLIGAFAGKPTAFAAFKGSRFCCCCD
jgi:hypothetical protein